MPTILLVVSCCAPIAALAGAAGRIGWAWAGAAGCCGAGAAVWAITPVARRVATDADNRVVLIMAVASCLENQREGWRFRLWAEASRCCHDNRPDGMLFR
jgi:hypothetical protein